MHDYHSGDKEKLYKPLINSVLIVISFCDSFVTTRFFYKNNFLEQRGSNLPKN